MEDIKFGLLTYLRRMNIKVSTVLLICLFCSFLYGQEVSSVTLQQDYSDAIKQAQSICQKTFTKNNFPGLAVAVSIGHETIMAEGLGYADVKEKIEVDPNKSLFRIGSVSKTLTAAALQLLVQEGKIDIEKNVRDYVHYFPEKEYALNVKQVAGHIAGIRHYKGPMEMMSNIYYPTVEGGMKIFMDDPLLYKPGEKYSYSSYGWNLISAIIESAAEEPFLEYMQEEVFNRFGMTNTLAEIRSDLPSDIVSFYISSLDNNYMLAPHVDNSYKWAGGGFIGTATDILKFSQQMHHSATIDKELLDQFQTPLTLNDGKQTNYGLGWATNIDKKGRRWVGHSGGSVGGTTMYLYYPDYDLTVVTLVNLSSAKMDQLAWKIAEQFISLSIEQD